MRTPSSRIEAIFKEKRIKEIVAGVTSVLMCMTVFVTVFLLMSPALTVGGDETALCGLVSHKHADGCYANGVLVCRTPEHEHDMACFSPALELYHYSCGYDYEHQHTQECFVNGVLICSMTEHTHGSTCGKVETPLKARFTALKLAAANGPDLSQFPKSGTVGTYLDWEIDREGVLRLTNTSTNHSSIQSIPKNNNRPWDEYKANITKVIIGEGIALSGQNGNVLFSGFSSCTEFDLANLELNNSVAGAAADLSLMFKGCKNAVKIDVSGWDTEYVTTMNSMFADCYALEELDVSDFDTSRVVDMYKMFDNCQSLTSIDLSDWNTAKVTNMSNMFHCCYSLEELDLSGTFSTGNVRDMSGMFQNCWMLSSLSVTPSLFSTSKVTDMSSMFVGDTELTDLSFTEYFDTSLVISFASMFSYTTIKELDLSGWNVSRAKNFSSMFIGCESLEKVNLANWDTGSATTTNGMLFSIGKRSEFGAEVILGKDFVIPDGDLGPFRYILEYPGYGVLSDESDNYCKMNSDGSIDPSVKDEGIITYQATSTADTSYVPYYAIEFNANGGTFTDGSETKEIYYRAGNYWSLDDAPALNPRAISLIGWDSSADDPSTRINGNEWRLAARFGQYAGIHDNPAITLYAEWNAGTVTVDTSAIVVAQAISTGDETMPQKTFTYKLNCTEPHGPATVTGTAVSSGAGCYTVDFGELEFNYPGSYHLEIMPVDSSACGWVINRVPKKVTVTVTQDSTSGALAVSNITPVLFTNVYSAGKDTASVGDTDKPDASQKNYTVQEAKDTLLKSSEWTDKINGEGEIRLIYNNNSSESETRAVYLMCTCLAHDFTVDIAKSNIRFLLDSFDYVDVITLEDQMHAAGFAQHCASFTSHTTDAEVAAFLDTIKFLEGNHAGVMYTVDIMTQYFSHFEPNAIFVSFDGVRGFGVDANPYAVTDSIYIDLFGVEYLTDSISYTETQKNTIKRLAEYQRNGVYYLMTADNDDEEYIYSSIMPYSDEGTVDGYPVAYGNLLEHFFAVVAPAVYIDSPDDVADMIADLIDGGDPIVWKDMLDSYSETYSDRVYSYDEAFDSLGVEVPTGRKFVLHDTIDKAFNIQSTAILDGIKVGFYGVDNSGKVTWTALSSANYTVTTAEDNSGNTELSVTVNVTNLSEPLVVRIPVKTELEEYKTAEGGFRATNIDDAYVDVTVYFENSNTHETSESTATTTSTSTPKLFKKVSVVDFYIFKSDEDVVPLQGVGFTLYALDSANAPANADTFVYNNRTYYKVAAGETDADGYVKFENLKTGAVYLFRETTVLAGYNPLDGSQEFFFVEAEYGQQSYYHDVGFVDEDDSFTLNADALVEGVIYNPDENNVFCVTNYPYTGEELPSTGGRGAAAYIAFGAVCMALAGGMFVFKKKITDILG